MTLYRPALDELPPVLPVFPLTGVLLLPSGQLPLNIFEPRYLAMVRDALGSEDRLIGMVQPRVPDPADNHGPAPGTLPDAPEVYGVGCAGRIVSFNEMPDGRNMIALYGLVRFAITEEVAMGDGYRRMKVAYSEFAADLEAPGEAAEIDRERLLATVKTYLDARQINAEWESIEQAETERLVVSLGMSLPFGPSERQALLEAPDIGAQAELLVTLLEMAAAEPGGDGGVRH